MDSTITPPPFPGLFQIAYVTRDIARAQDNFARTHGVERFMEMRDLRYETGPGREAHCHVSLAYVGAVELELIQPIDGDVQLYRDFLPDEGDTVRFHHVCRRFETRAALEMQVRSYEALGKTFPIMGSASGSASYFYCDFVAELGHYVEGIFFEDGAADWLAQIPRF